MCRRRSRSTSSARRTDHVIAGRARGAVVSGGRPIRADPAFATGTGRSRRRAVTGCASLSAISAAVAGALSDSTVAGETAVAAGRAVSRPLERLATTATALATLTTFPSVPAGRVERPSAEATVSALSRRGRCQCVAADAAFSSKSSLTDGRREHRGAG